MTASSRVRRVIADQLSESRRGTVSDLSTARLDTQSWTTQMTRLTNKCSTYTAHSMLLASFFVVSDWRIQPFRPTALSSHFCMFMTTIFTARCYTERGYSTLHRLSVRPSVRDVQVYHDHIGWNTSKIISRLISFNIYARADPNMGNLVQREHPQN